MTCCWNKWQDIDKKIYCQWNKQQIHIFIFLITTKENKTDEKKHYGIRNIQERVKLMGGTVEFVNDGGTTIAITIKNIIR